jgi:hypothetical protein
VAPDRVVADDGDDDPDWSVARGVPPAPSVTPGSAPPPPDGADQPRWSRRGCLVVSAVVGGLLLVLVAGLVVVLVLAKGWLGKDDDLAKERQEIVDTTGIESDSTDVVHPPQRDIRIGACDTEGEGVVASGTLTNWSDDESDYLIHLSFRAGGSGDDGAEFGSTVVTVESVESEATTSWSASVPTRPEGLFTCRIVRIDRWSSGDPPPGGS